MRYIYLLVVFLLLRLHGARERLRMSWEGLSLCRIIRIVWCA